MPEKHIDYRFEALWRFGLAITVLNLLGHTILGFEQSWAQPIVSVLTAYSVEFLLEIIDATTNQRPFRFLGGFRSLINFMLPAHITGLAVSMLLYANERLMPIIFASAVAVGSKAIFKVRQGKESRHFFNPSNFGITLTLLLFPWVGIAQPYQFTENLSGLGDWILPVIIVCTGTFLNSRLTRKMPLILAWLGCFALQALVRSTIFGTPLVAALLPMTGVAFILFTFYMVTDPGTTPFDTRGQVFFGASVAAAYGLLVVSHIVFDLFFALTIVCALRGLGLYLLSLFAGLARKQADLTISPLAVRKPE
jgi:Na+-translocating ferredoxin:NAD+ oxidoreductase RnfD subunit